jgi:hypothetical protein
MTCMVTLRLPSMSSHSWSDGGLQWVIVWRAGIFGVSIRIGSCITHPLGLQWRLGKWLRDSVPAGSTPEIRALFSNVQLVLSPAPLSALLTVRPRGGAPTGVSMTVEEAAMNHSVTQAQLFATEYAKDMARELLDTLRKTARHAGRVTGIALGVSMPHQVGFILSLAPLRWGSLTKWLESITLISGSVGIPIAVDFLILICIKILATRGAERRSKRIAIRVMWFPVLVSGLVNMLAPAPLLIRLLFGVAVVLIPAAEGLRASIRPDFAQIEAMETQIRTQVSPIDEEPADVSERAARVRETRERVAALSPAQQRYYRALPSAYRKRQYLTRLAAQEITDAVDEVVGKAPVSPAPAER